MKKGHFLGISEEGFHRIAYTEWGKESPRAPIICVHGLTRQGRDFDSLANYLSERGHHLFCPDIVGRGDSDWLKNPLHYTYEQYIADMTALIARTQKDEITWIGTSMGGLIGMFLSAQTQSPIKRLILNDVGPSIPIQAVMRISKYMGMDPEFSSVTEAKNYYKNIYQDYGELSEDDWTSFTEHSICEIAPQKFISKLDPQIKFSFPTKSQIAWQAILHPLKTLEGGLFDIDLWHIFRKVSCPILIIHGNRSDLLLTETILKMKDIHPNVEVIDVPNAGHAPLLKEAIYQEMIFAWIEKNS
jgi:pimeloyl-ACP methyl ester carboxylesterase